MTLPSPLHCPVERADAGSADRSGAASASHPVESLWAALVPQIEQAMAVRQASAGRTLVLLPYAQLMDVARRAWAQVHPSGFAPRFESSRHWAAALQPFLPAPTDLSLDMARDSLVGAAFIDRVAPGPLDAALRALLAARLVQAAWQLAPLAAAVPPPQRLAWAEPLRPALAPPPTPTVLHWESMLASLALAWVSTSAYATDVLWGPQARPGADVQALIVLQGLQQDPLAAALAAHWGERAVVLRLCQGAADRSLPTAARLHACADAQDEAQRAAACVIERVNAGRTPVALIAHDRLLTRRISAMLHGAGLRLRDETGWKLSTTRAAAQLMSLLRAAHPHARMDDVLDLLKQAPAWPAAQVLSLEQLARQAGVSLWRAALQSRHLGAALPAGLPALLQGLQAARALAHWLTDLAAALRSSGLWDLLQQDAAGQQLLQALRLGEGGAQEIACVTEALLQTSAQARPAVAGARLSQAAFTAWVREALEGASFVPRSAGEAAVVVLPMAQLLGRRFAAAVVPGCDENHLRSQPELPGQWTTLQRQRLGLASREALTEAAAQAWQATLGVPELDLLWRTQEGGETVPPSSWVQALPHFNGATQSSAGSDPRPARALSGQAGQRPRPTAPELLPQTLSASAYQDLRACPYRFFALRQLRLAEASELADEPDQRDLGLWLHAVLRAFHEQRGAARPGAAVDRAELDRLADATAVDMGLDAEVGGAGFLPYQAAWPALRDGYLDWLAGFEATAGRAGPRFVRAEAELSASVGACRLYGKLDRIDEQDSPEGRIAFVIDYKTESRTQTLDRVKEPFEDTQLAFYAALLPYDNLRAAYLSITDKRAGPAKDGKDAPTLLVEQPEVLRARTQLRLSIAADLARLAAGQSMPALGEGRVCDFCSARGLCRKDFWC